MALEPDTLDADCECEEGAPAWMATFSDLATLLLTFFVLLLSFAELNVVEYRMMLGSMREAFGVQYDHQGSYEAMSTTVVQMREVEEVPWTPLNERQIWSLKEVSRFIRQRRMSKDVELALNERGVVIRLKDRLAFGAGDAALRKEAEEVIAEIYKLTSAFPGTLSVEGHTDDKPIRSKLFPSNWELSTTRAIAVLRYMEGLGPMPEVKANVAGYADREPVVPNDTPEHRMQNRRVEFVFSKPEWASSPEALRQAQRLFQQADENDDATKAKDGRGRTSTTGPVTGSGQFGPAVPTIGPVIDLPTETAEPAQPQPAVAQPPSATTPTPPQARPSPGNNGSTR